MRAVVICLWIFGSFFVYCIGMGVTKAIGLKAWGKPATNLFTTRIWCQDNGNAPMVQIAQLFWPITLIIWSFIGLWWLGVNSPQLIVRFFRWVDKQLEEESKQAQLRAQEQKEAKAKTLPTSTKKPQQKSRLRSGKELGIYTQKKDR